MKQWLAAFTIALSMFFTAPFVAVADDQPLMKALDLGDLQAIKKLLRTGADPNKKFPSTVDSKLGFYPLEIAIDPEGSEDAKAKTPQMVRLLIKAGARIDIRDFRGRTLLHKVQDVETAELLISKGLNVNDYYNRENETPLHIAASKGNAELVDFLIKKGANVNDCGGYKAPFCYSPLHAAVWTITTGGCAEFFDAGVQKTVKILLDAGADGSKKVDKVFGTPFELMELDAEGCRSKAPDLYWRLSAIQSR